MKRFLFLTVYPSPYRVDFFDELGKYADVTVLFSDRIEKNSTRDAQWFTKGKGNFRAVQLSKRVLSYAGNDFCVDVCQWLKKSYDAIVVCGYSSPTAMLAIAYLKLHRIPFCMEVDGGLIREDSGLKYKFKKLLVGSASEWLSSGPMTTDYLAHYGADKASVHMYPFTSLWHEDILSRVPTIDEKMQIRKSLQMREDKIVLYVGRFSQAKGMDALLQVVPMLDADAGVYFVGGEPTAEHLTYCENQELTNVHFVGFKKKEALLEYYQAADLLVLPTKSDVWGLVINEAMACGLPVITTDQCVAGMELIENGVNGYLVPVDDDKELAEKINVVLRSDYRKMGEEALEAIRPYTIENMARVHMEIFENGR